MLIGQQIGPFLIEKELGAGAMGAVYRGKYVKTGQLVAVKVMAPGLGTSVGSQAGARFQRESEILKQLSHPNIVRHFGAGKHQGTPYYAMEYIQGESLDHVMARRDRMTWEEVVELGQQLCSALEHAHQAGIVHRDLKPSNLMILTDGTLKLTDFGIAKDLDVTALTAANCTIGTAAYMSPEQCKGDPNLTSKSDLYSLGVVLYELVTGKKPFVAENAMDMFMQHVNGTFERPSRLVLDVPMRLDYLICQLLEKKPEQRPLDAGRVEQLLAEIQEKEESQKSAGVDAAKARRMDQPRGQSDATDEDKEAARALLGRKRRGRKAKKDGSKRGLMLAFQAGGILFALASVLGVVLFVMQPEKPDKLVARAAKLMDSPKEEDWDKAVEGPIKEYLRRYGDRDDDNTKKVKEFADAVEVHGFEKVIDRYIRNKTGKTPMAVTAQNDAEKSAFEAALAEHNGQREEAMKLWKEALEKDPEKRVRVTARKHLEDLTWIGGPREESFESGMQYIRDRRAEPPELDEHTRAAFRAWRQEKLGDSTGAKRTYARLREAAEKDGRQRRWVLFAAVEGRELKEKEPQSDKERKDLITAKVDEVEKGLKEKKTLLLDARAKLHDVAVLYEKDEDFAAAVKQASELITDIDRRIK